jgi:WD40 repeat protein
VRVWQLGSRSPPKALTGHAGPVNALAATRDGRRLVSGSWDGTVRVWDWRAPLETGYEARHVRGIRALAVTADGRLALSTDDDRRLRIWDLAARKSAEPLHAQQAPIGIAPNGSIALTAGGTDYAQELVALDLRTRSVIWRKPYFDPDKGAYNWTINSIAFTPDGTRALVGSTASELTIWDIATGKRLRKLRAHEGCINSVKVAHDARVAVTGSNDGTVRVWPLNGEMTPSVCSARSTQSSSMSRSRLTRASSWRHRTTKDKSPLGIRRCASRSGRPI